jgi:membrane-associated phospholipid phosphatase
MARSNPSAPRDDAATRDLDRLVWTIVAIVAAVVLLAPLVSDFQIAWRTFCLPAAASAGLLAGSWFYRAWRPDPPVSSALGCTAQMTVFTSVAAPLSYLAAGLDLPLQDSLFDALDRALGFDWSALSVFVSARPTLSTIFRAAYMSLTLQTSIAVLALAFSGQLLWLRVFILSFILAALVTIAISAVLPGVGAWGHRGTLPVGPDAMIPITRTSPPVFYALRDGTLRQLMAVGAEGIITFPSLHAALALILIIAMWPIAGLRWLAIATNAVMIASTPIDGAHYLVDILAGLAIALVCVTAARALAARAVVPRPRWPVVATHGARLLSGEGP